MTPDDHAERLVVLVAMATRTAVHRRLALSMIGKLVGGRVDWMEVVDALASMDVFTVLDDPDVRKRLAEVSVKPRGTEP
jgi:hypothetical protein